LGRKNPHDKAWEIAIETLFAVVSVFVEAYNRFGKTKHDFRIHRKSGQFPFSVFDFI